MQAVQQCSRTFAPTPDKDTLPLSAPHRPASFFGQKTEHRRRIYPSEICEPHLEPALFIYLFYLRQQQNSPDHPSLHRQSSSRREVPADDFER
ncbi:hypothetical protein EPR50_G00090440 [Perca flavescens]|uniref:Uncharacterized protein n=1 Tax=Perca flavescens TaxID=8167 RepID=A0A484D3R7_PERFV|nr:hypothetical protein EPR50_G00090440 [Perca flavescens]